MKYRKKLFYLAVLLVGTLLAIVSGTMAYYSQRVYMTASIETAKFNLLVNGSSLQSQALSAMNIAPGETQTRTIQIDASECETPIRLTVTLSAALSGTVPSGFSMSLDGIAAGGGGTLQAIRSVDNAQSQLITMTVSVSWSTKEGEDLSAYSDFTAAYDVIVEAVQISKI